MDLMADAVVNVHWLVSTRLPYLHQHVCVLICREYINVALITIGISVFMLLKVPAMVFACATDHSLSRLSNALQRLNRPPKARTQLATAGLGTECARLTLGE